MVKKLMKAKKVAESTVTPEVKKATTAEAKPIKTIKKAAKRKHEAVADVPKKTLAASPAPTPSANGHSTAAPAKKAAEPVPSPAPAAASSSAAAEPPAKKQKKAYNNGDFAKIEDHAFYVQFALDFDKFAEKAIQEAYKGVQEISAHKWLNHAIVTFESNAAMEAAHNRGTVVWKDHKMTAKRPAVVSEDKGAFAEGQTLIRFTANSQIESPYHIIKAAFPAVKAAKVSKPGGTITAAFDDEEAATKAHDSNPVTIYGSIVLKPCKGSLKPHGASKARTADAAPKAAVNTPAASQAPKAAVNTPAASQAPKAAVHSNAPKQSAAPTPKPTADAPKAEAKAAEAKATGATETKKVLKKKKVVKKAGKPAGAPVTKAEQLEKASKVVESMETDSD